MKVYRYISSTQTVAQITKPFYLETGKEELIYAFDQSSSNTALVIGNLKFQIFEFIVFTRDKYRQESVESYLTQVEYWLKIFLEKSHVKCYSIEDVILTSYAHSDKITKQVRGVLMNIYQTAQCLDADGNKTYLTNVSEVEQINNREWQGMVVPKEYFKHYKDRKKAIFNYVLSIFPGLARMPMDIADAVCMYIFLLKTKYGNAKLKPTKATINWSHHLVVHAIPYRGLGPTSKDLLPFSDGKNYTKLNSKQIEFMEEYRKSYIKNYVNLIVGNEYDDDFIRNTKEIANSKIFTLLKFQPKRVIENLAKEIDYFNRRLESDVEIREFEFTDKLTLEENIRCFTGRDNNIYYTVIPRTLAYCYIIPMFDLSLDHDDNIMIIATKI